MSVEKLTSLPALHSYDKTNIATPKEAIGAITKEIQSQNSEYQPTKEEMEVVIDGINELLQPSRTHLKFELHEKLNEYYVTIINNETDEVVREIPSKKWLDIYASMTEFVGLIVDEKI